MATGALVLAVLAGGVATQGPALFDRGMASPTGDGSATGSSAAATAHDNASTKDALRSAFLTALLDRRAEALLRHRRKDWLTDVDPFARGGALERFDRMTQLPWASVRYTLLGENPDPPERLVTRFGPSVWSATVEFAYRLPGDTRDVRRRRTLTIRPVGDSWRLVADVPADGPRDLWDLSDVTVRRGDRSLVVAAASVPGLPDITADADLAAAAVDLTWGRDWTRTLTLVVPATTDQMALVLGRTDTVGLDQIAAVTTGELDRRPSADDAGLTEPGATGTASADPAGTVPSTTADRIVVNPDPFRSFTSPERRIVLTHEATHVAVRATARVTGPIWLEEGFADFVAYGGTGLTRRSIAADLLAQVRAGRTPQHLPGEEDFDPAHGSVAPAYAGAWLAFDLIASTHGRPAAVRFAKIAAGIDTDTPEAPPDAAPLQRAFAEITGGDQAAFERAWIAWMTRAAEEG